MIGVLIVPTGIGCEIGGHAGDANPVAKLLAACCDKLITHPNVVNASDINEMTENTLYVEGSMLDQFLKGDFCLREQKKQNKILVVANAPLCGDTINAVSSARVTIGIDAEIVELKTPLRMVATMEDGKATGDISGVDELLDQISKYTFDALAIHTPIEVPADVAKHYYRNAGVNPWGGVEAKASKMIAARLRKPVAHAPLEREETKQDDELFHIHNEIIDPRIAPEAVSICYLHCVLKGLNRAPGIDFGRGIDVRDVDFMVSPIGCWGAPHEACKQFKIPIIVVGENEPLTYVEQAGDVYWAENYWEAAGRIMCWKAGIHDMSVRRPLPETLIQK